MKSMLQELSSQSERDKRILDALVQVREDQSSGTFGAPLDKAIDRAIETAKKIYKKD